MNWFANFYFREGPGIDKNAPKPEGLRLLASVFAREWWDLLKLNLLFVLFALPLITVPAAVFAMISISMAMIADRNIYLLRDFWQAFRARFFMATLAGLVLCGIEALSLLALFTYIEAAGTNLMFALPLTVAIAVSILIPLWFGHFFVALAVGGGQPLGALLKASTIGMLAHPLPGIGALAFIAMLWLIHIAFYPVSVFLPVLVNFSLGTLVFCFAVTKGVQFGFSHLATDSQNDTSRSPETQSA
jgi:uncharacterized membrane protein YesL